MYEHAYGIVAALAIGRHMPAAVRACVRAAAISSFRFGSVGDTFRSLCTAGTHAAANGY